MQEIVRDVPKEYRNIFIELINKKEFSRINEAIEKLKYKIGGEYTGIKKLLDCPDLLKQFSEKLSEIQFDNNVELQKLYSSIDK